MSKTYDLNIQSSVADMYENYTRYNYTECYALAEFIDNSTSSFYLNESRLIEAYLQYTLCGKKKTEYLREQDVSLVQSQLSLAEQLRQNIGQIDAHLQRLEAAVKILDAQMSRSFVFLRQCADMDALPVSKRTDAILFANAMTALEGLPAREETERNLNDWASGKLSFADFYLPALQNYHVMEDDHA